MAYYQHPGATRHPTMMVQPSVEFGEQVHALQALVDLESGRVEFALQFHRSQLSGDGIQCAVFYGQRENAFRVVAGTGASKRQARALYAGKARPSWRQPLGPLPALGPLGEAAQAAALEAELMLGDDGVYVFRDPKSYEFETLSTRRGNALSADAARATWVEWIPGGQTLVLQDLAQRTRIELPVTIPNCALTTNLHPEGIWGFSTTLPGSCTPPDGTRYWHVSTTGDPALVVSPAVPIPRLTAYGVVGGGFGDYAANGAGAASEDGTTFEHFVLIVRRSDWAMWRYDPPAPWYSRNDPLVTQDHVFIAEAQPNLSTIPDKDASRITRLALRNLDTVARRVR